MKINFISKNATRKLKKYIIAGSLATALVVGGATLTSQIIDQPKYTYI